MEGRSWVGIGIESDGDSASLTFPSVSFFLLSAVERRLTGRLGLVLSSRLSVLPWTERGGVRGEGRYGLSVGRRAAGMYIGALGGRSWRLARGRPKAWLGDIGDRLPGVWEGSSGEDWGGYCCGYCWGNCCEWPCELGGVTYACS